MWKLTRGYGPTCMVLGLAVWACWPSPSGGLGISLDVGGDALKPIAAARLEPELHAPSRRDPFRPSLAETAVDERSRRPETTPQPDWRQLLDELHLSGVVISKSRKFAVINQRLYSEGAELVISPESNIRVRLERVLPKGIAIRVDGRAVRLEVDSRGAVDAAASPPISDSTSRAAPPRDQETATAATRHHRIVGRRPGGRIAGPRSS